MSYVVMTDTSANLPFAYAKEHGVTVIPFSFYMDGEEHTCLNTEEFDAAAFYGKMLAGTLVSTSQITPGRYEAYFRPVLEAGKDILFVGLSSGVSGAFASSKIAAQQLTEEYPERKIVSVDTLGASLGEGLLAMQAVEWKEEGMPLAEAAERLLQVRHRMYQIFTVDDLKYLRRGGRLSNATAIVGSILNIKPLLKGNEEGKIVSIAKIRGRSRTIAELAARYDALVRCAETQRVGISHANCPQDAEALAARIAKTHPPKEILIVEHEPATGSYLGPGALALYFLGDDAVRTV